MANWQYNVLVVDLGSAVMKINSTISKMWEVRGPDGLTDWDRLQQMGRDGWELVNTFSVAGSGGATVQVIWVFKRQQQQQQPATQ